MSLFQSKYRRWPNSVVKTLGFIAWLLGLLAKRTLGLNSLSVYDENSGVVVLLHLVISDSL